MKYTIYIGWDSREEEAYRVCEHSIRRNYNGDTSNLIIKPLVQDQLRAEEIYTRDPNEPASTAFAFTRFLVPFLQDYQGLAVFMDCDMLVTTDIRKLFAIPVNGNAISCVQHDYTPKQSIKMDGQKQINYPRKNWSSLILWNCAHLSNGVINPTFVNSRTAKELHRFTWLKDKEIRNLDISWNWLEGEYHPPQEIPNIIHFTNGGPWFENYQNVNYADIYYKYKKEIYK